MKSTVESLRRGLAALVALLLVGLAPGATPVAAQAATGSAAEDGRFWYSVGLGAGSVRFTCDICATGRDPGATLHAGFGARASDRLDVGLEGGGWTRDDDGVRETVLRLGLRGILRPNPDSGFQLLGGLGWVGYSAEDIGYDAVALSVGVGWDWPLADRWRIGNRLMLDAASWGSLLNEDEVAAEDVGLSVARLEVTLTRR